MFLFFLPLYIYISHLHRVEDVITDIRSKLTKYQMDQEREDEGVHMLQH